MTDTGTFLELRKVTKSFPGVLALNQVDFDVRYGEVIALVGENGAGKSTLIKLLGGVYQPDGGTIIFDGREVIFSSTQESQQSKISVIYQEFNLIPELTVAENIFIGREPKRFGRTLINWKKLNADASKMLDRLESSIEPNKLIKDLPIAERQMIEIAKALSIQSKLIIMDEPTASLTDKEVRTLFKIIKRLREENVSIIYISHRLEEAFELSERITVLRDGKKIGTKNTSETNENEIIEMMVGKVVMDYFLDEEGKTEEDNVMMEVKGYSVAENVENVSFQLNKGEILGIAGIIGSGVHGLLQSLYGVLPKKAGEVYFEGKKVDIASTKDAIRLGIGYVTDDRKDTGILPDLSVLHNITITILKWLTFFKGLFVNQKEEVSKFDSMVRQLNIKYADKKQKIIYLSGGNQQKVVMGRTLLTDCKVLILLEPTRGIDVGSKAEIHRMMRELANRGMSIIFTSSELTELVNLPDRCLVLYRGELVDEFDRTNMNEERLVSAQIGHAKKKIAT